MSRSEVKKFTQVTRTASDASNLLDPLSMFALEGANTKDTKSSAPPLPSLQNGAHSISSSSLKSLISAPAIPVPEVLSTPNLKKLQEKADLISSRSSSSRSSSPVPAKSANSASKPARIGAKDNSAGRRLGNDSAAMADATDDDYMFKFLTGEQKIMNILDSFLVIPSGETISGVLFMTNYRLVFIPSAADLSHIALQNPAIHSLLQVPLAAIERIDRDRRSKDFSGPVNLVISCKDFRILRVAIRSAGHGGTGDHDVERAISVMAAYCFPNNMRFLFAFSHKFAQLGVEYAPEPYDAALEFSRMGVLDNPYWRVTGANASYKLCNTYPQWLVVPSLITDEELHVVSAFRSGHRLPVMCWCNKQGISMWRSSQPKAGVSGTCTQDERMLDAIARSMHQSHTPSTGTYRKRSSSIVEPVLYIVDCRSRTSAMANRAAGAGYESQTNYPHTRLDFYSISNIHGVRDSYKAMAALLLSPQASVSSDLTFLKMAEDTQWLTYTRTILKASLDTANLLNGGFPVLVHCSHGWDRTAQVCSLAQLFLDPYYRTFEGFRVLIEKEWVALGHPFQMRSAHAQDKSSRAEDQMSPVMIQFLDCVWQILHQFQHYFEFNSRYLLSIADHVYSGRFGTFLFSCDYDRDLYNTRHLCADLWTYLNQNRGIFANPFYQEGHGVLLPPLSLMLRNVTLWKDYFFRWSAAPSLMPTPIQLSQLLHFDGICRNLQDGDKPNADICAEDSKAHTDKGRLDFEVNTINTSDDFWEAAFRIERAKRENAQVRNAELMQQQEAAVDKLCDLLRTRVPGISEAELAAACGARVADAVPSRQMSGSLESLPAFPVPADPLAPLPVEAVGGPEAVSVNGVLLQKYSDLFVSPSETSDNEDEYPTRERRASNAEVEDLYSFQEL